VKSCPGGDEQKRGDALSLEKQDGKITVTRVIVE